MAASTKVMAVPCACGVDHARIATGGGARKAHGVDATIKSANLKRLRRIEGQVRGVSRMVEEDRDCREIVQQLAAVRAAAQQVGLLVARSYACQCVSAPADQAMLDDLISMVGKTS